MNSADSPASATKARLTGFDVLRVVAVLLVLGRHMPAAPPDWPALSRGIFGAWQRGGWVGVDLFFVLSGFLVSGLLFAEYNARRTISPVRFFTRRGWKIYPPLLMLVVVTVALNSVFGAPADHRALVELFFLQSYRQGLWNHTWSLAVEEHFYLMLPLLLVLLLRFNRRSPSPLRPVLAIGTVIVAGELALRLLTWHRRPVYSHFTNLFATHLRLDSLFFGVMVSYAYHFHREQFVRILAPWRVHLLVTGTLLFVPAFVFDLETTPFIFTYGLTLFYLGAGMVMVGALLSNLQDNRVLAGVATIGIYSYSIYLWHMPMLLWGVPLAQQLTGTLFGFGTGAIVYVGGSLAAGALMARLVESPSLHLRDRWFPSHPSGVVTGTQPSPPIPPLLGAIDASRLA